MSFATIHTAAGLQAMYAAAGSGTAINLTHMAVGDGNGAAVTPTEDQTALTREVFRATINRVYRPDPTNQPAKFAAELVVPATEGGFVLREVGVFDGEGTLFAVGNLPETYKPQASEGAFADTVVRVEFIATNTDVVTVQLDPNVTVATQQWITNNVTACNLLPGGTTGQVLTKASNDCGDVAWADPTDVNVTVDTIEEIQTLADSQTVVTLSTVTNVGLAVYVDGARLPQDGSAGGWAPDGTDPAKITLGQSYTAGTQIICAQNEPAGGLPDALIKGQNLADVPDKAQARDNLDIYSRAQVDQKTPPGLIGHFARATAPVGWLKANGAEVSRTAYSDLFAAIGTQFGAGNGVDTFNLPDLRGEFVRGLDDGRGIDGGRALGGAQGDGLRAHDHGAGTLQASFAGQHTHQLTIATSFDRQSTLRPVGSTEGMTTAAVATDAAGGHTHAITGQTAAEGGTETRPRNIALLACIKY